ncbi:MAG TPA: tyrosine--tRNA ligase [Oligoflexia bacterium]|nr:tyrosine--tRNA ligase [Oligoflexia bacterium]HMP27224.1 tyrosine--tRNA ligase [Oligoflexia bacterium]
MNLLHQLKARGLLSQISNDQLFLTRSAGERFYFGIDPSSPHLSIGNYLSLLIPIHLARAGWKPVILFGGATGAIGDPSDKSSARPLLTLEQINQNISNHQKIISKIFQNLEITNYSFVNNYDWTAELTLLNFLRDIGKHFPVAYMIDKDFVARRLNSDGISYMEFSYMLLQAYDFYHLFLTQNVILQVGGGDQWGNMTAGLELIRRKLGKEAIALSASLLLDNEGKKIGKSEQGTIFINPEATSPYKLHQYLLNQPDKSAITLLKQLTFLSLEEIEEISKEQSAEPSTRIAQKRLADEVCAIIHGVEAAREARKAGEALFGGSTSDLPDDVLKDLFAEAPSAEFSAAEIANMTTTDLVCKVGFAKSKTEARKLIESGGFYINNERVADSTLSIKPLSETTRKNFILRSGKKNYFLIGIK